MSRYVDKKEYIERVNRAIKRRVEVEAERDALAVEVAQLRAALWDFYDVVTPNPGQVHAGSVVWGHAVRVLGVRRPEDPKPRCPCGCPHPVPEEAEHDKT